MKTSTTAGHAEVLPSVDCIFALTVTNSSQMPLLEYQLLGPSGMMHRTSILEQRKPDPDGETAAIARAHIGAWNASLQRRCHNTLVLEDDAFFEDKAAMRALPRVESFLKSGTPYDLMLLGWGGEPSVETTAHRCVYGIKGWSDLHAYVISSEAAQRLHTLEWPALQEQQRLDGAGGSDGGAIDTALVRSHDRARFYAIRPRVAFQRHRSTARLARALQHREEHASAAAWKDADPTAAESRVYTSLDQLAAEPGC